VVAGQIVRVLLGIPGGPLLELLLVLGGGGRRVLCFWVLAVERGRAAVGLEELGGRLIAADLHNTQLVPLPFCRVLARDAHVWFGTGWEEDVRSRLVDRTKEMWTPRLRWLAEQSRHR
jgi:hypothetical protein